MMMIRFLLALAAITASVQAQGAAGGRCPENHPWTATLGINLVCLGGSCAVNMRDGTVYYHDFSTEPRIAGFLEKSPSFPQLREGDAIVAVDGALITTREGGRRLANLRSGVALMLTVRRGGGNLFVPVTPEPGCNMPSLSVTSAKVASAAQNVISADRMRLDRREEPAIDFGLDLGCDDCGTRRGANGAWYLFFSQAPRVQAVEQKGPADRAGIQADDELLSIDGRSFTDRDFGRFLQTLIPEKPVRIEFRRGEEVRTVTVTPRERRGRRTRL